MTVTRLNPNVRTQIESIGLTQREVARALEASESQVSKWLNGNGGISTAYATRLLDLLQQHFPAITLNDMVLVVED